MYPAGCRWAPSASLLPCSLFQGSTLLTTLQLVENQVALRVMKAIFSNYGEKKNLCLSGAEPLPGGWEWLRSGAEPDALWGLNLKGRLGPFWSHLHSVRSSDPSPPKPRGALGFTLCGTSSMFTLEEPGTGVGERCTGWGPCRPGPTPCQASAAPQLLGPVEEASADPRPLTPGPCSAWPEQPSSSLPTSRTCPERCPLTPFGR